MIQEEIIIHNGLHIITVQDGLLLMILIGLILIIQIGIIIEIEQEMEQMGEEHIEEEHLEMVVI